jgi:hypothetical protein
MAGNVYPHQITWKQKSTGNSSGWQTQTYAEPTTIAALISPTNAQRLFYYAQRNIKITHSIYTSTAISPEVGDIITYGSRTFVIDGFTNVLESGRLYLIDCHETTEEDIYQDG